MKNDDPLGLGKESKAVSAPVQWLVVMGPKGTGKSTLIRQMKHANDGCDIAEALRFARETHKAALALFKQVVKEAEAALPDDLRPVTERLLALKRRAMITAEVAADVHALWEREEVRLAEEQLADARERKACRHFFERIDDLAEPDYVPASLDLLHLKVPTVGQQETRIQTFPGGALSLFEVSGETSRSSILFGTSMNKEVRTVLLFFGPRPPAPRHTRTPPVRRPTLLKRLRPKP